jgi:hypothetical protein
MEDNKEVKEASPPSHASSHHHHHHHKDKKDSNNVVHVRIKILLFISQKFDSFSFAIAVELLCVLFCVRSVSCGGSDEGGQRFSCL